MLFACLPPFEIVLLNLELWSRIKSPMEPTDAVGHLEPSPLPFCPLGPRRQGRWRGEPTLSGPPELLGAA